MSYPIDFVDKVCSEYAEDREVLVAAADGKYGLGVHLARGAAMMMSPEDIIFSIVSGDCDSVREDAERAVRRRGIHAEWMRIVLRSISSMSTVPPPPSRRRTPSYWAGAIS